MSSKLPPDWGGACIPIQSPDAIIGILFVAVRLPRELTHQEADLLTTLAEIAGNAIHRLGLHERVVQDAQELAQAYETTLEGWSHALDLRDRETEGHTQRVTAMAVRLARAMGMSEAELGHVRRGGILHDIGKMGIPDAILLKPGALTDEEWRIMRQHPVYAYNLLSRIEYLKPALDIPYCHHEKWDGTGYPRGLKGEKIPFTARIFAVADVWDALRSDRPYRPAWSVEQVREYIRANSGTHFDPKVVAAFLKMIALMHFDNQNR